MKFRHVCVKNDRARGGGGQHFFLLGVEENIESGLITLLSQSMRIVRFASKREAQKYSKLLHIFFSIKTLHIRTLCLRMEHKSYSIAYSCTTLSLHLPRLHSLHYHFVYSLYLGLALT
jgi:hypothetical protein